jgi:hypothetical protein
LCARTKADCCFSATTSSMVCIQPLCTVAVLYQCTALGSVHVSCTSTLHKVHDTPARYLGNNNQAHAASLQMSAQMSATSPSMSEQTRNVVTPSSNERVKQVSCYWKHLTLIQYSYVHNATNQCRVHSHRLTVTM